jgi:hypothetical protein
MQLGEALKQADKHGLVLCQSTKCLEQKTAICTPLRRKSYMQEARMVAIPITFRKS